MSKASNERIERMLAHAKRLGWLPLIDDVLNGALYVVYRRRLWVEPLRAMRVIGAP